MATYRKITKHGNVRWLVEYGIVDGARRTASFKTEAEARAELTAHRKDRRELGNAWLNIEPSRRYEFLKILAEIKRHNVTLGEVWDYFKANNDPRAGVTVADAVEEMINQKRNAGARPLYLRELTYGLGQFVADHGADDIASIRDSTILQWLDGKHCSASTRATLQRRLSTLFGWAARRKYVKENIVMLLEPVRITKVDPQILTVDQCRRLVNACHTIDADMLCYLGLALFCGIRPEECMRLTADAIDLNRCTVTISGDVAKTRNRRIVSMTEPAIRMLSMVNLCAYKVNFRKRLAAIRKEAKIKKWPKDVLRHTAASHMHNIYTIDEATKQLGHSADVMLRHYRQLVTSEDTKEWLEI